MTAATLIRRSLWHYRRAHLGVAAGAATAAAVLIGALAVGDSVRYTLRRQGRARIGRVRLIGPVTVGNDESLYLGHSSLTGWEYFLTGGLDEVRIWDYARQQAEIQADMGAALTGDEPGLIGYWNFEEEPSSQWALDATAFQSHGRLGTSEGPDSADPTRVPEPALLSILAAGAFVLTRRRRR